MTDPTSVLPAQPWYVSKVQITQVATLISALIAMCPKLGSILGWTTPAAVQLGVESLFGGIAVVAPIIGSILRAKSAIQPLTLTQAGADSHPANVAATAAGISTTAAAAEVPNAIIPPDPTRPPPPAPKPGAPWGK